MKTKLSQLLDRLDACSEAVSWVGEKSLVEAWTACEQPDWLLWLINKSNIFSEKEWRLLACSFARTTLPYTTDPQVLAAIEVAERFAVGEATQEELNAAGRATYSATYCTVYGAAYHAAYHAAWSAACHAAYSAAYSAVDDAGWNATYKKTRKDQCDLIRSRIDLKRVYEGLKKGNEDLFP